MAKPITGKTHVGERREKRPNGDIYVYERITAYNEKTRKTYTVSQKLKGKIKSGKQNVVPTRPKKHKGEGGLVDATRRHTGLTDILEWVGKISGIDDDLRASFSEGDASKMLSIARYWIGSGGNTLPTACWPETMAWPSASSVWPWKFLPTAVGLSRARTASPAARRPPDGSSGRARRGRRWRLRAAYRPSRSAAPGRTRAGCRRAGGS